jgi:hypothetical protein
VAHQMAQLQLAAGDAKGNSHRCCGLAWGALTAACLTWPCWLTAVAQGW